MMLDVFGQSKVSTKVASSPPKGPSQVGESACSGGKKEKHWITFEASCKIVGGEGTDDFFFFPLFHANTSGFVREGFRCSNRQSIVKKKEDMA